MKSKRILIVDDEPSICRILKRGLEKLDASYDITTAEDGKEALARIQEEPFDLIVTDYKMSGLDGLALLEEIRRIQPETRVVLMTAYGSGEVEARARRLNAYRYLTKPLEMDDFRQMVQEALSDIAISREGLLMMSDKRYRQAANILKGLQEDVGARCILLVNVLGQIIIRQGDIEDLPVSEIVTLLGGGIATLTQAGKTLDGVEDAINLIYRESSDYHLYGINVGENLLMVILIANTQYSSPLGSVWYYARRIVEELRETVGENPIEENAASLGSDFGEFLNQELDALFGTESNSTSESESKNSSPRNETLSAESVSSSHSEDSERLLGFEEAIQRGILPATLVERISKGEKRL